MADESTYPFPELRSVCKPSGPKFNHLNWNWNVAKTQQNSELSSDSSVNTSQNSSSNAWRQPNVFQKLSNRPSNKAGAAKSNYTLVNSQKNLACSGNGILDDRKLPPQSEKGIHSSVGVDTTSSEDCKNGHERNPEPHCESNGYETVDSESNIVLDSEDDHSLDDTDSDTGERSHEGCKKSKWFKPFFDNLNKLTIEEINSQERQWHCPACQGGPGAIDWYQGLQPLLNHSKTIKVRWVRLHRLFAKTLGEECFRRGAPLTMDAEAYGRWEGLDKKKVKDHEIVWPPMVVILNTRYERDESNKWNGMGNQELLDCFSDYAALKARHSYGPQGHRGMSVLIFEASTAGYLESKRLHKHFKEQGRGREAWNRCQNPFVPGGKRKLYGYLASREDLIFSTSTPEFEMKSYQEMVDSMPKLINNDSQQIKSQVLADTLSKEQIQNIQQAIHTKEDEFEKIQQEEREKLKQFCGDSTEQEQNKHRPRGEDMIQFVDETFNIIKVYGEKELDLKNKLWQELKNEVTELMDKYTSAALKKKTV